MTMRLIDKAAMALAQEQGADWGALSPQAQEQLRASIYAALAALREPDELMAEAGAEIIRSVRPGESEVAHQNDAVNTWRFMIDALLGERQHFPGPSA